MNETIRNYYEEMNRILKENKPDTNFYTKGDYVAYRAYRNSVCHKSSELECDNLPWKEEVGDFVASLKNAGAETIAITDNTSALMETLHLLAEEGCTIDGLCKVTHENTWHETETVNAIRIKLN